MRRIKSGTVQSMVALWLFFLVFLIVMHRLQPGDPWTSMMARPIVLVFVPLLVACVPLLTRQSKRGVDSVDDDEDVRRAAKPGRLDIARRMALVWIVSLVVFALPLGTNTLTGTVWDPLFHRPVFLIVAPLLLACIPLLFPKATLVRRRMPAEGAALARSRAWSGVVGCLMGAVIAGAVLLLVNDKSLAHSGASRLWPNIAFTIALVAALMRAWYFVKLLREPR